MQDTARLRKLLEPRSDVDAVAVNRVTLGNHITQVDTHPEGHPPVFRQVGILVSQPFLSLDGALYRIDCAGKLDQQAIAGSTDDAPVELDDLGLDDFGAKLGQASERA
jgi:hypothetical protein